MAMWKQNQPGMLVTSSVAPNASESGRASVLATPIVLKTAIRAPSRIPQPARDIGRIVISVTG